MLEWELDKLCISPYTLYPENILIGIYEYSTIIKQGYYNKLKLLNVKRYMGCTGYKLVNITFTS